MQKKKKHEKNDSRTTLELFYAKTRFEKTPNNKKITRFRNVTKLATLQRLQPLQNGQFGAKIKNAKNDCKTILELFYAKNGSKNT